MNKGTIYFSRGRMPRLSIVKPLRKDANRRSGRMVTVICDSDCKQSVNGKCTADEIEMIGHGDIMGCLDWVNVPKKLKE